MYTLRQSNDKQSLTPDSGPCALDVSLLQDLISYEIILCRVFFPQDIDSAAEALLAGGRGTR